MNRTCIFYLATVKNNLVNIMSGNHSRFKLIFLALFQLFIGHDARITPSGQLKNSSKN